MNARDQPHPRSGATPAPSEGDEAAERSSCKVDSRATTQPLALVQSRDEPRIDSRVLAYNLRGKHKSLLELVRNYKTDFEALGKVPFQTEALPSGQSEKFVPLTEDQAYLLLTYTRNTARTRSLKLQLVKAFSAARRNAHLRQAEYLLEYHALHDQVAELARGSANQQRIHANFSRLVNKVAGIEAGQRSRAPMAILATVCSVAARAMADATDHRDGYQRAKAALMALAGLLPMAQSIRSLDTTKVAA